MKRTTLLIVLLAGGIWAASLPASAEETPAPAENWFSGKATLRLLGRGDVDSSKFEEYRAVPKGISMPDFTLVGSLSGKKFALFGENISQRDQRYSGYVEGGWFKVTFDYNQIMHNIGFGGRTLFNETAPGVWSMSTTLRSLLQTAWDATPSASKTYPWLLDFWGPSLAASGKVDVSLQRNRGTTVLDLGQGLGFSFKLSYVRETRKGAKDTTPVYVSSQIFELPTPTDTLTQDFGLMTSLDRKWGNIHGAYHHNWFKNNLPLLMVDNPLRATDAPYVNPIGGPAQGHNVMAPDNSASTLSFGALLKFGKQTRLLGDVARGQWKQNAAFFPYTFNTTVLTAEGTQATSPSSLPAQSLNGKIDTMALNVSFSSRPLDPLYLNLRYRSYDFKNNTPPIVSPGYVSWDRSWSTTGNTSTPFGYKTGRFETIVGLNFGKTLALEGAYRHAVEERTFREAEKNTEKAFALSAIGRGGDWALVRATYENAKREASGIGPGVTDLYFDEAKRKTEKVGFDIELSPFDPLTVVLSYFSRKDTYQNPSWGYQSAKYNTLSGEVNLDISRLEATVYYTIERNQDGHKGYQTISNMLEWYTAMADDKTDSFGGNVKLKIVPDKWDFSALYRYQKVNGFLNLEGSAAIQATRAGNGGIQDIPDFDDTSLTTLKAQLSCAVSSECTLALGAFAEKYTFDDASVEAGLYFPAPGVFMLSPNYGSYNVTAFYTSLAYRW